MFWVAFLPTLGTNWTLMVLVVDEVSFIDCFPDLMTLKRMILGPFSNNQFCLVSLSR